MRSQWRKYSPMLYPQNGSIAIGSRRTWPTVPAAAAVISEPIVAPMYTPWIQLNAWYTSGIVVARRPPKMIAEIGTPFGSSASGATAGLFLIGAAKRLFGCAAFSFDSGVHGRPCQSSASAGGGPSLPSHQISPSGSSATFVNSVSRDIDRIAFGFDLKFVP